MSKYTPGPWRIVTDHTGRAQSIFSESSTTVCSFLSKVYRTNGAEGVYANARLISAAPDLLEALDEMLTDIGRASSMPSAVKARAAIRKAKGEQA